MSGGDPFRWEDSDEDELRAICRCGWRGEWREFYAAVRADEEAHACEQAVAWRAEQ